MESLQKDLEQNKMTANVYGKSQCGESTDKSSTLLAWSSGNNGNCQISIQDYQTREPYANFPGVKLYRTKVYSTWTHVKEVPDTNFLISAYYSRFESANFTVLDTSTKIVKTAFSFEEAIGAARESEISVNKKQNLMALIPLAAGWIPQFADNQILTLDIDPEGRKIALINKEGLCIISDISSSSHHAEYFFENDYNKNIRCRWGGYGDPGLFNSKLLNIFDPEKKMLILKESVSLEEKYHVVWIDKCPSNENLLALVGDTLTIYDRRESTAVKKFETIHSGTINCVRWSADGKMLGTASDDTYGKIFDLRMEKEIFAEQTADRSWAYSACFL